MNSPSFQKNKISMYREGLCFYEIMCMCCNKTGIMWILNSKVKWKLYLSPPPTSWNRILMYLERLCFYEIRKLNEYSLCILPLLQKYNFYRSGRNYVVFRGFFSSNLFPYFYISNYLFFGLFYIFFVKFLFICLCIFFFLFVLFIYFLVRIFTLLF